MGPQSDGHFEGREARRGSGTTPVSIPELERQLAVRDVEGLVGVRVKTQWWSGILCRQGSDHDDVGLLGLGRSKDDRTREAATAALPAYGSMTVAPWTASI